MPLSKEMIQRFEELNESRKNQRRYELDKGKFKNSRVNDYQRNHYIEFGELPPGNSPEATERYHQRRYEKLRQSAIKKARSLPFEDIRSFEGRSRVSNSHLEGKEMINEAERRISVAEATPRPIRDVVNLFIPDDQEVPEEFLEQRRFYNSQ